MGCLNGDHIENEEKARRVEKDGDSKQGEEDLENEWQKERRGRCCSV